MEHDNQKIEHEHIFWPKLSDNGTPIEICRFCGCQDGNKFWAKLNDKWNFHYDFGKWFMDKIKRLS